MPRKWATRKICKWKGLNSSWIMACIVQAASIILDYFDFGQCSNRSTETSINTTNKNASVGSNQKMNKKHDFCFVFIFYWAWNRFFVCFYALRLKNTIVAFFLMMNLNLFLAQFRHTSNKSDSTNGKYVTQFYISLNIALTLQSPIN